MLSDCKRSWYQALAGVCVVGKHRIPSGQGCNSYGGSGWGGGMSLLDTDLKSACPALSFHNRSGKWKVMRIWLVFPDTPTHAPPPVGFSGKKPSDCGHVSKHRFTRKAKRILPLHTHTRTHTHARLCIVHCWLFCWQGYLVTDTSVSSPILFVFRHRCSLSCLLWLSRVFAAG